MRRRVQLAHTREELANIERLPNNTHERGAILLMVARLDRGSQLGTRAGCG